VLKVLFVHVRRGQVAITCVRSYCLVNCNKILLNYLKKKTHINYDNSCSIIAFEDTKGVIRIRIFKKNRQHEIGLKKKDKRTNNHLQNIHIKLKIE
jgi:hypothetical protein